MTALVAVVLIVVAIWFAMLVIREYRRSSAEDDAEVALSRVRLTVSDESASHLEQDRAMAASTSRPADTPSSAWPGEEPALPEHGRFMPPQPVSSPPVRESARWIPAGVPAEVHGYVLPSGLVYVGRGLPEVTGLGTEPALIDPSLPLERSAPDRVGAGMPYWPSYGGLSPRSRAGYLEWLANGRRAPDIGIGYVFLFFYGLERRVLHDASHSDEVRAELPAIRKEVSELLSVYGSNRSFERYATQLLDVLDVALVGEGALTPPTARRSSDLPLGLRVELGKLIAAGQPIPAAWALAWLLHHPEAQVQTPSRRCAAEFQTLFVTRYAREFGAGMIVKSSSSKLEASVQPASASFGGAIAIGFDLPDIARLKAPLGKLQTLADACEADLEAYSRWVGRNPDAPKTLAAVALLPAELVASDESSEVLQLWQWIRDLLKDEPVGFCESGELLKRCASLWGEKLTKAEAVLLAQLLHKGGYGLEPDVRFGGGLLSAGDVAALFQLEPDAPAGPSAGYAAAAVLLHLGVALAAADGSISEEECHQLEEHVERNLALSDPERRRLTVHLTWLMRSAPRLTGLKKRLEPLDAGQRELVADFVVSAASADGRIAPKEVKTIGKIFTLLGIPEDAVYARLHAVTTGGPQPEVIPIVVAGRPDTGFAVPPPPAPRSGLSLDMDAVAAKIAQSASVADVLSEIFTDGAAAPAPTPPIAATSPGGLSPAYTSLLAQLAQQSAWSRDEFERLVGQHQLLPDAAVEALNDAAFERCAGAVLEGDDPLEIDSAVAKELLT